MVETCPTDDALAAFAQRAAPDSDAIAAHLDDCDTCRNAVLAAARAATPSMSPTLALGTPSMPPRGRGAIAPPGSRIGRYTVQRLLGSGGMGHVYEAYDDELDRSIALKVLRPELVGTAASLTERLLRESRLTAKIANPAVMTIYDVGHTGDAVFIAMELIRGETLGAYVTRARPPWRDVVALYERAAAGLAAAHAAGIIHRDFKPENVLVEGDGARVVVTDFGIARAIGLAEPAGESALTGDVRLTATGVAIGTPAYMAPEQLAGKTVDPRADVFAFAVSLWEAVFGARPFPGTTLDEIRAAMAARPRPTRPVPRRLVRALERGLALDPAARWPDMPALSRELAAIRGRRRRRQIAGGAAGVIALGATGVVLAWPAHKDPCARPEPLYDQAALTRIAPAAAKVIDERARSLRATDAATCHANREPAQEPSVTACLDARRLEVSGVAADIIADGPRYADKLVALVSEPGPCVKPPPAGLFAHEPADPALRRKVTALRYRLFDGEQARDRGDFAAALAIGHEVAPKAEALWAPLHAEALYLVGNTQSLGGAPKDGLATLQRAAAVAESAHHDYIAASAWVQLAQSATFDQGDPARGLEYLTYADAALDRMGHPALAQAYYDYTKATTLIEADRTDEAEKVLRETVELSKTQVPALFAQAIQGLGYLYEQEGRYPDAVVAYRDALAHLRPQGEPSSAVNFRGRLAIDLSLAGKTAEALPIAREAAAIADKAFPEENTDRAVAHACLAQVLSDAGDFEAALREAQSTVDLMKKAGGDRNERYGEALSIEALILSNLGRYAEAEQKFARACDVIAFQTGDGSSQQAECWLNEADALSGLGRDREALALMEKVMPVLIKAYGEVHPQIAEALVTRGALHSELHQHDAAVADLEAGVAQLEKMPLEKGHLAAAQWALAKELWRSDRKRAHQLIETALATFETASAQWRDARADAAEWLATDGHPRKR